MWILTAIAITVLAPLIYLASLNGSFRVRRSLEIEAPLEQVFAAVVDLKSWPQWSPWLLHEPDAELIYSDDYQAEGGYFSWAGKVVGAGKLTHLEIRPQRSIHQQIEFLKPFRSVNQVDWEFEKLGGKTLVSWEMSGRMPFLFRFMAKRMEPMIGRDYELGLALLGGYLNRAMAHPVLVIAGPEELEDFGYWAIPCIGNLRQLEAARRSSIETLRGNAAARIGLSLTLYQGFDPYAAQFQAEIAVPVNDNPPPSNYRLRRFAGGQYIKMTLRGDLRFVPLAWHAVASHCRLHKLKIEPQRPALEIYGDDPGVAVDDNRTTTTLYLPIKT
jgi:effector-binding domain-containing protein/uncharacterized protein YndB with AHSA1/START domain